MRRLLLPLLLVVVLVPAAAFARSDAKTTLSAALMGSSEVPKGPPTGTGSATITITGTQVCWKLTFSGIDKPTASHIHKGAAGVSGPVVVPLGGAFKPSGCTKAPAAAVKAIVASPGAYYVNIHTAKFGGGAVRGQLANGILTGTVGPGFTISLKMNGQPVKALKAGTYEFVISDKASIHSFSLDGPHGLAKDFTTVPFIGTKTASVLLKAGAYKFYCPPHESTMFGHFTVT